jgi:hypothetical protein
MRRFVPPLIASLALTAFFAVAAPARAGWVWPVTGDVITPYRNGTDPYATGQHRGIDIAAPVGAPVVAAAGGAVRFAGTAGSSGLTIGIRTTDGYDTSYLHLSSLAVRAGAQVSAGERIGAVGTTGLPSATAPHLHFGVRDAGTRHDYHDPLAFLPPPPPPARAPDPPPEPVTAPQPAPPAAAPVIHPRPRPVGLRRPTHAPRAAPRPDVVPRPQLIPRPRRHLAPIPRAAPHPRVAPRPGPVALPRHVPRVALDLSQEPAPHSPDQPGRQPQTVSLPRPAAPAATRPHTSPGIGWVAACAGLLLAGALLGFAEDGRRAAGRTGSRLWRALPLPSRR